MAKDEESLGELWGTIKNNVYIIGVLEGEERGKGEESLFEE